MLRRFPRRNRLATGCVSPCLPVFQWLLFFFPLAGNTVEGAGVSGWYWCSVGGGGFYLVVRDSAASPGSDGSPGTGYSVRCVRAREGQAIPCFFPLSGWDGVPAEVSGPYWTSAPSQPYAAAVFAVYPVGAGMLPEWQPRASGFSVRCVRAREGQAIPLFWIVGFLGSLIYEGLAGVRGIQLGVLERVWPVQ